MRLSLHNFYTGAKTVGAGLLLGPFLLDSLHGERWPVLVLSCLSIAIIFGNASVPSRTVNNQPWMGPVAALLVVLGMVLSIEKILLLAGVLFLVSASLAKAPLSWRQSIAVTGCACLIVPLPAGLETDLATTLANIEAWLFVSIGQALNLPVRLSGTQIFLDQSVVTINQNCSGTLLLTPALLGSITAAALSESKTKTIIALSVALPAALLINLLRLAVVLSFMAGGDDQLANEWHDALGFAALALSWVLPLWLFVDMEIVQLRAKPLVALSRSFLLLLIGGTAIISLARMQTDIETPNMELPAYFSGWIAERVDIPSDEIRILNADQVTRRRYTSENGEFLLTAIYHNDPKTGREHTSAQCFRAMGWQVTQHGKQLIESSGILTFLSVSSGGHQQAVAELQIENVEPGGGLLRIQLVTSPDVSRKQQQRLISPLAKNILGEKT